MPGVDRVILCGGASAPPRVAREKLLPLRIGTSDEQVKLKITDLTNRLASNLPDVLIDLVEVATYVYCADQALTRGGNGVTANGQYWRRRLSFHIPVRVPELWSSSAVMETLRDTLGFLSDDEYQFHFSKQTNPAPMQSYLEFQPGVEGAKELDEVILFSGGLDSLGGAVIEAVRDKRRIALVSHRANPKIYSKQKQLVEDLQPRCQQKLFHIPVWVQKGEELDREYTQRTRSFLFASLAAVVARAFGLSRVRFYENGIVSLNLPISEQATGARATRTTHPRVLNGYRSLFGLLTDQPFEVENPFLWLTKGEVVSIVGDNGCADLIKYSVSCTHTRAMTKMFTHCGKCSQCVGRRFATLSTKYADYDPREMYGVDLLTGDLDQDERNKNADITLFESFIRIAVDTLTKNEYQLTEMFPEMSRIFRHVKHLLADEVATRIARMHQRHAEEVTRVLAQGLAQYSQQLLRRELPRNCGIILAFPEEYKGVADSAKSVQKGVCTPKQPARSYQFDTPRGTDWHQIVIRFLDGHTVNVVVGTNSRRYTYAEMNMKDGRSGNPTKQWNLLQDLARNNGSLSWNSSTANTKQKKQVELLAHRLKKFFNISGSPFYDYQRGSGWKMKIRLEAPR